VNDGSGFQNMKWTIRCIAVAVILSVQAGGAASGGQSRNFEEETRATWTSVFDGHLNDAIARAAKLLSEIDPIQDGEAYWRASSTLVEIFQELENDALAEKILGVMVQKKIAENPAITSCVDAVLRWPRSCASRP
jgi:hypothetical protein